MKVFNFFLTLKYEYTIMKVEENQKGSELKWTHMLLVCDDDINLLGKQNIINKNKETL
jgi:hypothetical protein